MAALHAASFARGWSKAEIIDLLSKPTTRATHTEHGFALLQVIPPEAELLTIVIDPARRGRGHAHTLLAQTLRAAVTAQATRLFLEVDALNQPARALYARHGFAQTGIRKGYYAHADGRRSDALLLTCELSASSSGK